MGKVYKRMPRTGDKFYVRWADDSKHKAVINWIEYGYKELDAGGGNVRTSGKPVKGEKRRGRDAWGRKISGNKVEGNPDRSKPKVLNKKKDKISDNAVFIGRPSKWGNPFKIGVDGDRKTVIEKFEHLITHSNKSLVKQAKKELRGKDLICFCAPLPCHGDVWLKIANS